jgi:hypothetical protein
MRKKKHNSDEIRFCQSRLHKQVYEFRDGETGFLISVSWDNGNPIRMVVCKDCFAKNIGTLIKEVTVVRSRAAVLAPAT